MLQKTYEGFFKLMDNADIRLRNVRLLITEHGAAKVADELDMSRSQLSQIAGRNPTRAIGKTLARRIEQKFSKPRGWLDVDQRANIQFDGRARPSRRIPVLTLVQAGTPEEFFDSHEPGGGLEELETELELGRHAFGLIIRGDSMQPEFNDGDKIIVDPGASPQPGDYVVAKFDTGEVTFKKYRPRGLGGGGQQTFELTPLNDDYASILTDETVCRIVATMVEHRRYRKRR